MTKEEYEKKLDMYKRSDADIAIKDKAIAELQAKFNESQAADIAREQFVEGQADLDDVN